MYLNTDTDISGTRTATRPLPALTARERNEYNRLPLPQQALFNRLRRTINGYSGVARREADRGSRTLLRLGYFRMLSSLLPLILRLTRIPRLPSGWRLRTARPLLVGNVLYNLAFPETINQGGRDRLGGRADPTCFSASTQMLLAKRYPNAYVRLVIQLATTRRARFAGGARIGPLRFVSTSLYKSLDSVLLQTAFDTYFRRVAIGRNPGGRYIPGDELEVHRQVFGARRPPRNATYGNRNRMVRAFRRAFVTRGGNTRRPEIINLCVGNPTPRCQGNHTVLLTRIANGRVYFYNPWANEEERNAMWGSARVTTSGNGERPAESSMRQRDFERQITTVFHN